MRHATKRGVRVLPEFDSPAHVGAGWDALDPEFTLCVNKVKQELQCSQKRRVCTFLETLKFTLFLLN